MAESETFMSASSSPATIKHSLEHSLHFDWPNLTTKLINPIRRGLFGISSTLLLLFVDVHVNGVRFSSASHQCFGCETSSGSFLPTFPAVLSVTNSSSHYQAFTSNTFHRPNNNHCAAQPLITAPSALRTDILKRGSFIPPRDRS